MWCEVCNIFVDGDHCGLCGAINQEHGPDCNCEDCWWSHDCHVVDEFGIAVDVSSEEE